MGQGPGLRRVVVTGSHGLIGSALVRSLEADGVEVTRLSRPLHWDPEAGTIDVGVLEGHDAVVHLAGAGVADHRWSSSRRSVIRESRVRGTTLLAGALAQLREPPAVLASGSAIGFYGDRPGEDLTESSPPGAGFLAEVVKEWEAATAAAEGAGSRTRVLHLRTGVVLSRDGGALARQLLPFRLGLGGRLGGGRQDVSWIAIEDWVRAVRHLIGASCSVSGPVNLTAPSPVTNREFTETLGRVLRRPAVLAVPRTALRVAFGADMAEEMLLVSQRVLPAVLLGSAGSGFSFRYPTLEPALREVLGRRL